MDEDYRAAFNRICFELPIECDTSNEIDEDKRIVTDAFDRLEAAQEVKQSLAQMLVEEAGLKGEI